MNRLPAIFITLGIFFLIDLYAFQAVKTLTKSLHADTRRIIHWAYWLWPVLCLIVWVVTQLMMPPDAIPRATRQFIWAVMLIPYFAKFAAIIPILLDDIIRLFRWLLSLGTATHSTENAQNEGITRSRFLMKTALTIAGATIGIFGYGIVFGAHNYKIKRVRIPVKGLPKGFEGLRIAQISDIHSGSFFDKKAVERGVQMILDEKPDVIFFTGDLVNNTADEIQPYIKTFGRLKAPLGVFSILGNHDYGDYYQWPSKEAKIENLKALKTAHARMGWDLLLDEHRILTKNGDKIALIGIENWGMGGFAQYGDLAKAYQGTEPYSTKLLLSHDPSHWEAQVRPHYPNIDIAFAGHTHGMQFGIDLAGFKWSPVQYRYKQWSGLYTKGSQHLYVNRGFGYIGYPGRVGMTPEITIVELVRG